MAVNFHPALLLAGTAEFLWTLGLGNGFKPRVGRAGLENVPLPLVSMVTCLGAEQWPEGEFIYGFVPGSLSRFLVLMPGGQCALWRFPKS